MYCSHFGLALRLKLTNQIRSILFFSSTQLGLSKYFALLSKLPSREGKINNVKTLLKFWIKLMLKIAFRNMTRWLNKCSTACYSKNSYTLKFFSKIFNKNNHFLSCLSNSLQPFFRFMNADQCLKLATSSF